MESIESILYKLYQAKMADIADTYCEDFSFLDGGEREAWRGLALHLIAEGWAP